MSSKSAQSAEPREGGYGIYLALVLWAVKRSGAAVDDHAAPVERLA